MLDIYFLIPLILSFLVSFALGFKMKRYLVLIPSFFLSGVIGFLFSMLVLRLSPQESTMNGGMAGVAVAIIGTFLSIILITLFSAISGIIGGAIGTFVSKRKSREKLP